MWSWLLVGAAFLLDLTVRMIMTPGVWGPDIFLLAVIHTALTRPLGEAYLIAFLSGLAWDGVFLDLFGMHAFLYLSVTMIATRLRLVIWSQYAVSRLFFGFLLTGMVRFGEVIFWLSNLNHELPIHVPKRYVMAGALTTGILYLLIPNPLRSFRNAAEFPQILTIGRR